MLRFIAFIFLLFISPSQWDSELEDDSDDGSFAAIAAKPVQPKPVAKIVTTPSTIVDDTVKVLENLSINSNKDVAAVDRPASIAVAANPAPIKAPAKKAQAKKKAAPKTAPKAKVKKSVSSFDSSGEESDDFMGDDSDSYVEVVSAPAPSRARSGRAAAQKVTYVIESSDEEMSEEESDF